MSRNYTSHTYLVGYYGMQNTGDDALMTAAIHGAYTALRTDHVKVSSPIDLKLYNGEQLKGYLHAKQAFPGQNRLSHYARSIESNRIIFGGGSVLHNAHDIDMKRDMMMLSGGRDHLALGVGIGPFKNTRAEKSCAKFLNACAFTGVRDPQSYEIAQAIAPNANVKLTFDLAPQLLLLNDFRLQPLKREGIAVCLCPHERLHGNHMLESGRLRLLAMALEHVQKRTGEKIYLVDFNGHSTLGDEQVHSELAHYFSPNCDFAHIKYDSNPLRALQRIASYKAVVGMRLHASIFAYMTETPLLSLNYHSKCEQWCEQIGVPEGYQFSLKQFDPKALESTLTEGLIYGFKQPKLSIDTALNQSMNNWRYNHEISKSSHFFGRNTTLQQRAAH